MIVSVETGAELRSAEPSGEGVVMEGAASRTGAELLPNELI